MCGIVGFIDLKKQTSENHLRELIARMTSIIAYRGPDDHGVWTEQTNGIAFGHRRLSILDLSQNGHQPMVSSCDRYILSYNGEIYNFTEIRQELEKLKYSLQSNTDTEVLLTAIQAWGVEKTLKMCNGMFAFALYDKQQQTITLARDRLGVKPLYWGQMNNHFFFSSELKALYPHPAFSKQINMQAQSAYFEYGFIPRELCIFDNMNKLLPGHILELNLDTQETTITSYWKIADHTKPDILIMDKYHALDQLEKILLDATAMRMVSEVPLGSFLSGGIDSSLITALMQIQSNAPVKTFSIGFDDEDFNECNHAQAIAEHLGTDHTPLIVTAKDARNAIPLLPTIYDEPFGDSSAIPTYLLAKLARKQVTVALTGDGGDEMFQGYYRHAWSRNANDIPRSMGTLLRLLSPNQWNKIGKMFFGKNIPNMFGDKVHKFAHFIKQGDYKNLFEQWNKQKLCTNDSREYVPPCNDLKRKEETIQLLDILLYLPDDILTKVDRATMSNSLEARSPFLDYRVAEFAWQLSPKLKIKRNSGKWIVKELLKKYIPQPLFDRPKAGFSIPLTYWLQNDLKDWAHNYFDDSILSDQGLNKKCVQKVWGEFQNNKGNHQHRLWTYLMYQAWYEENIINYH
jgi:asparagine synthase (glutamine-hydrolysing)